MNTAAVALLRTLTDEISTLTNPVVIEGHTDSRPYTSRSGYSNWELSTERANSTRRVMEKAGLRAEQVVQIRGYADKKLRHPEQPYDVRNRRISIALLYNTEDTNAALKTVPYGIKDFLTK